MTSGAGTERADPAEVAEQLRAVLAAVDDGELSCSAGFRNRLQGAVLALERLRSPDPGLCPGDSVQEGARVAATAAASMPRTGRAGGRGPLRRVTSTSPGRR